MKSTTRKICFAGLFTALAVVGSLLQFPIFGSKCAPVQHLINILCAVILGPWYGVAVAFLASLLRNLFGIGSLLAFPGSMLGALLCGLVHKWFKKIPLTIIAEVFGTAVLGGLCAYPVAILFMGKSSADIAFYVYIIPFLISTVGGSIIAAVVLGALKGTGTLRYLTGEDSGKKREKRG